MFYQIIGIGDLDQLMKLYYDCVMSLGNGYSICYNQNGPLYLVYDENQSFKVRLLDTTPESVERAKEKLMEEIHNYTLTTL